MKIKKVLILCPVILIVCLLFYISVVIPIANIVRINRFTDYLPHGRALKFVLPFPFVLDEEIGTWELSAVDKKCLDFESNTNYWTVKNHDGVFLSADSLYGRNDCYYQIVKTKQDSLPRELNTDNFKAIGIYEDNSIPSGVEIWSDEYSFADSNTAMLHLTSDETARLFDILNGKAQAEPDNISRDDFYSLKKRYSLRLFMNEDDTIFLVPNATLAFDGEQWKLYFNSLQDGNGYIADIPFDSSLLAAYE